MNIFKRLLGHGEPSSSEIAKDRLRLVLVQDRVNLSAEKMNELKDELIKVISKYVDIDREGIEISLSQTARQSRLTANIPLVGVRQK